VLRLISDDVTKKKILPTAQVNSLFFPHDERDVALYMCPDMYAFNLHFSFYFTLTSSPLPLSYFISWHVEYCPFWRTNSKAHPTQTTSLYTTSWCLFTFRPHTLLWCHNRSMIASYLPHACYLFSYILLF
jgi:hypothetical protein